MPLALDLHLEPLADGVHGAHADAVEPSADLVARVIELAARVKDRHDDLGGADAAVRHDADGDAATVVLDRHRPVEVDRHVHPRAEAAEVLVDGVVDDLPHQVVKAGAVVHVADVHARALADRLETLENGDAGAVVAGRRGRYVVCGVLAFDMGGADPSAGPAPRRARYLAMPFQSPRISGV